MAIEFGNLETVNLRDIWAYEADDFTPWLANNLGYISDAIGVPLELVKTEASVKRFFERFWADTSILASAPDGGFALIENQLEWADSTHLGQLLIHLAELESLMVVQTVIWVAREFPIAHLSAIRWLNENTAVDFAFFAIRVDVVKKSRDSSLIPQFEVLERPSDWDRRIRGATGESGRELSAQGVFNFNLDFWTHYADRYPDDGLQRGFSGRNPSFPVQGTEFTIIWSHAWRNRVSQWVTSPDAKFYQSPESMEPDLPPALAESMAPYLPALDEALGVNENEMWDDADAFIQLNIDISNP